MLEKTIGMLTCYHLQHYLPIYTMLTTLNEAF